MFLILLKLNQPEVNVKVEKLELLLMLITSMVLTEILNQLEIELFSTSIEPRDAILSYLNLNLLQDIMKNLKLRE